MDILVQLDDGTYANVETQKVGYKFPLARADCYASDIIMRQYISLKAKWNAKMVPIFTEGSPSLTPVSTRIMPAFMKISLSAPMFAPFYQEIADFITDPEELIHMFSEELYIMDRNTERLMVAELQEENISLKETLGFAEGELALAKSIFRLRLKGSSLEEIADELNLTAERAHAILEG